MNLARAEWDPELCALFRVPERVLPKIVGSAEEVGRTRGVGLPARRAPHRGHRRRPAGGALRPGVLSRRGREMHLRHGRVRADEHRRPAGPERARARHHRRLAGPGQDHVRARRQRVHRGRGRAVAARRARHDQERRRDRGARAAASPRATAWSSFPRSPGSARPTGTRRRAAPSPASRGGRRPPTSRAPRSRASPSRCATCSTAMAKDAKRPLSRLRVDGGAAENALLMQFQADVAGVDGRASGRCRVDRARRCHARRARRGPLPESGRCRPLFGRDDSLRAPDVRRRPERPPGSMVGGAGESEASRALTRARDRHPAGRGSEWPPPKS